MLAETLDDIAASAAKLPSTPDALRSWAAAARSDEGVVVLWAGHGYRQGLQERRASQLRTPAITEARAVADLLLRAHFYGGVKLAIASEPEGASSTGGPLVDAAGGDVLPAEPGLGPERSRRRLHLDTLVNQLSPDLDIPTPAEILQARRNAEARALLLREFGALTSSEVAEFVGSEAKNRGSLAHRWKREGRLLGVSYRGTVWYPGFQFHDGIVLPVIADVLAELAGAGLGEWETALWFSAPNGWLHDQRPCDLLLEAPARVVDAARHEVAELGG